MNIDWIEGATHYGIGDDCPVFFRNIIKGESYEFKNVYSSGIMADWLECTGYIDIKNGLIERPKKQEAWDGEGLPPAGTVCDMHIDDFGWITGTVVVHIDLDEPTAVAHNGEEVFHGNASDFRPIKTAEQMAEEEKKQAIDDMQRIYEESMLDYSSRLGHASRPAIKALYEAGYRKQ